MKRCPLNGSLPIHLLHLRRQAVKPVAQINPATSEKHLSARREADQATPCIARSTRVSAFSLTNASTLTRAPFGSAISIDPALHIPAGGCCTGSGSAGA